MTGDQVTLELSAYKLICRLANRNQTKKGKMSEILNSDTVPSTVEPTSSVSLLFVSFICRVHTKLLVHRVAWVRVMCYPDRYSLATELDPLILHQGIGADVR